MNRRFGAYRIVVDADGRETLLGRGGFASVYLARHEDSSGEFALKLLEPMPGNDPDSLTRFRRELHAARRVSSRFVARVYEWDLGDQPWIAMQYVPGRTLKDVTADAADRRLSLPEALRVVFLARGGTGFLPRRSSSSVSEVSRQTR